MHSVSALGVWSGGKKVGREVRSLLAFLDFQMLLLGGQFVEGRLLQEAWRFATNAHIAGSCSFSDVVLMRGDARHFSKGVSLRIFRALQKMHTAGHYTSFLWIGCHVCVCFCIFCC